MRGARIHEGRTLPVLDDMRGGGSGADVLHIHGGDAVGVACESGLQGALHGIVFAAFLARRTAQDREGLISMARFRRRSCSVGWRATLAGRNLQLLRHEKIGSTIAK